MKRSTSFAASTFLGLALCVSAPAAAQDRDLDPASFAAAVTYSLPHAFEGFMTSCFDTLDPAGFAVTNAPRLRTKFEEAAVNSWPGARELMLQMAAEETGGVASALTALDDDTLRPLVDSLIEAMAATEADPENCEAVERGLEIFDPMPAENIGAMVGFLIELAQDDDESRGPLSIPDFAEPERSESYQRKLREQDAEQ